MQVKRDRLHQCGLSNVDFRRLNDREGYQRYKDDMRSTDFGLMGRTGVPYSYTSCGYGTRHSLEVHGGFKLVEPPDPRFGDAKKYYEKIRKPLVLPASVMSRRLTQLEPPLWNEKVFTGEDVSRLTWYQNNVLAPVARSASSTSPANRTQAGQKAFCNSSHQEP